MPENGKISAWVERAESELDPSLGRLHSEFGKVVVLFARRLQKVACAAGFPDAAARQDHFQALFHIYNVRQAELAVVFN